MTAEIALHLYDGVDGRTLRFAVTPTGVDQLRAMFDRVNENTPLILCTDDGDGDHSTVALRLGGNPRLLDTSAGLLEWGGSSDDWVARRMLLASLIGAPPSAFQYLDYETPGPIAVLVELVAPSST